MKSRLYDEVVGRLPSGQPFPFAVHRLRDSHVSPTIRASGRWEPFATRILWSLLEPGDGVIDIGGNIGWYATVLGRAVGPNGWVHSFEPDPLNGALLQHNIELQGLAHVEVHCSAVGAKAGTMQLSLSNENRGDHRLISRRPEAPPHGQRRRASIEVSVETLDDFVERSAIDLRSLRVIKIDTQGAEAMILRGAAKTLERLPKRTALLVEFAPNLLAAHGPGEVESFIETLTGLRRTVYTLRRASIVPTGEDRLRRLAVKLAPHGDEWAVDLLVCPDVAVDRRRLMRYRVPRPMQWV